MSVVNVLSQVLDSRKGAKNCRFNGFLEDFVDSEFCPEVFKEQFSSLLSVSSNLKVMSDYRFNVNQKAISNQIIRYKDVFKLPPNYFDFPFIIYGNIDEKEFAIMISEGETDVDYFLGKGMYYCVTEQYGLLESVRSQVLLVTVKHISELASYIEKIVHKNIKIGHIQRQIDSRYFKSFEQLREQVMQLSQDLVDNHVTDVLALKDRSAVIYRNVAMWFLFKKLLYVQYMVNRDLLKTKAEGNLKKHRTYAKECVDQVSYVAFSEMWRVKEAK